MEDKIMNDRLMVCKLKKQMNKTCITFHNLIKDALSLYKKLSMYSQFIIRDRISDALLLRLLIKICTKAATIVANY